jgi:hypothetical protein
MSQLGADVEALDQLAQKLDSEGDNISQSLATLTSQLQGTWWQGTDATQFRGEWEGQYTTQLRNIAQALHDAAGSARKEAEQQRQASAT